jgi:tRNA threonylcarbamoyl adenosine modification protein (Sua5/YciO/YrdC/YwlC family)
MPPGIPVATVGINAGLNAALLAVHILARIDRRWEPVLKAYRGGWKAKIQTENEAFLSGRPMAIPWEASPPSEAASLEVLPLDPFDATRHGEVRNQAAEPPVSRIEIPSSTAGPPDDRLPHTTKPGLMREAQYVGRIRVDSELLPLEVAENATDCLLDGGIVALPTDTVYGLAVDATNPAAVSALCDLKGRDADRPIAIFIESQKQLAALVKEMSSEVRRMLEAFWPGPLTVVFERRSRDFDYLSPGTTIGVRLPDHSVALALLQELRRPIACSSANPSGAPPARSGDEVEQYFGRDVQMILDAGKLPSAEASTVIDVSREPFRLLREGPISRAQLSAVLGDFLESDEGD